MGDIKFYSPVDFDDTSSGVTVEGNLIANANVGIGTASPSQALHVIGSIKTSNKLFLGGNADVIDPSSNSGMMTIGSNQPIRFTNASTTEYARITTSGNVGIGTTSPSTKLHVVGGSSGYLFRVTGTNTFNVYDSGAAEIGIGSGASQKLKLYAADSLNNGITIDTNGNVGIGTTSPAAPLSISNSSSETLEFNNSISSQSRILSYDRSGNSYRDLVLDGLDIIFKRQSSETVRITSSGNVGIGTTSPSQKLDVVGNINLDGDNRHIYFGGTNTFIGELSNSNKLELRGGGSSSSQTLYIDSAGQLGLGTSSPTAKLHAKGDVKIEGDLKLEGDLDFRVINSSGFGQPEIRLPNFVDTFWRADRRFTLSVTGGQSAAAVANLFNGSYGNLVNFAASSTHVITINVANQSGVSSTGFTYPQGYIYFSFYSTTNNYDSISGRVKDKDGNYHNMSGLTDIISNNTSYKVMRLTVPSNNYAIEYELTLVTNTNNVRLAAINYVSTRHTSQMELPYLAKTLDTNRLFGNLDVLTNASADQNRLSGTGNSYLAANTGNVGIGTTSPTKKLDVVSNTTYDGIQISGSSIPTLGIIDTTNNAKFYAYVRDSDATIGMETNHPLTINTNNTERMRITSAGNIGIGTTSPSEKLDVSGSIVVNTGQSLKWGAGATRIVGVDGSYISLYPNNSEKVRFLSNGNVLIGTTTDSGYKLNVNGTGTNGRAAKLGNLEITTQAATATGSSIEVTGSNSFMKYVSTLGHKFVTRVQGGGNTLEALTIIPDTGRVGIGVTNPHTNLTINDSNTSGQSQFAVGDTTGYHLAIGHNSAGTTDGFIGTVYNNDAARFDIRMKGTAESDAKVTVLGSGNVSIGTTNPSYKLEVHDNTTASHRIRVINGNTGQSGLDLINSQQYTRLIAVNNKPFYVYDQTANSELFTIKSGGNVGIGATSPSQKLHVDGHTLISAEKYYYVAGGGAGVGSDASGNLILRQNNANLMTTSGSDATFAGDVTLADNKKLTFGAAPDFEIYHNSTTNVNHISSLLSRQLSISSDTTIFSGNVGIGTASPTEELTVVGLGRVARIKSTNDSVALVAENSGGSSARIGFKGTTSTSDYHVSAGAIGTSYTVFTNDTERMRITSGGNVGIGTTSPGAKLHVAGAIFAESNLVFKSTGAAHVDHSTTGQSLKFRLSNSSALDVIPFEISPSYMASTVDMYFGDNDKIRLGASSDLQIYHDGTDSIIQNYVGSIYIDNNADNQDIVFRCDDGSGGIENYIQIDGSAGRTLFNKNIRVNDNVQVQVGSSADLLLHHNGTHSYISNTTGDLNLHTDTGTLYLYNNADDGDISFQSDNGSGGLAEYFRLDGGSTMNVFSKPIWQGDGVKSFFGNSQDLEIYHDGSNSHVADTGTGSLILTGTDLQLKSAGDEFFMYGAADGQVALYHNGVKKFETGSTGVTVFGAATATSFSGDGSNLTNVTPAAHNHNDIYYTETEIDANFYGKVATDAKFTSTDGTGDEWKFTLGDESNLTGNKWYKVAQVNTGSGGLHIKGSLSNHVESFGSQKVDLLIQGREANQGQNIEITGTVDVLHNETGTSTDKAGIRVIKSAVGTNYDTYTIYIRTTRYSQAKFHLTKFGTAGFYLSKPSVTSEPAPVTGGNVELDTSGLTEGNYIVKDSSVKTILYDNYDSDATFSGNVGIGTTSPGQKLHVVGDIKATNKIFVEDSSNSRLEFASSISNQARISAHKSNLGQTLPLLIQAEGIKFGTVGGGEKMRMDSSGNVGIGTTSPGYKLEIAEDTDGTADLLMLRNSDSTYAQTWGFQSDTNKDLVITGSSSAGGFKFVPGSRGATFAGNVIIGSSATTDAKLNTIADGETTFFTKYKSTRGTGHTYGFKTNGINSEVLALMDVDNSNRIAAFGANEVSFNIGGNQKLKINSAGNVGIGTTNPTRKLQITDGEPIMRFNPTTVAGDYRFHAGDGKFYVTPEATGIPTMTYSSGNVGIGTTSPGAKLEVRSDGSAAGGAEIRLQHANNNTTDVVSTLNFANNAGSVAMIQGGTTGANNTGYISFFTDNAGASSEKMRILGDGNVGIGTTSPTYALDVETSDDIVASFVSTDNKASIRINDNDTNVYVSAENSKASFGFNVGVNAGNLNVDTSGNVGIGTASPSQKLHINNSTASSASYAKFSNAQTGTTTADGFDVGVNTGDEAIIWQRENSNLLFATSNSEKMRIDSSGRVGIGTTNPDAKLHVTDSIRIDTGGSAPSQAPQTQTQSPTQAIIRNVNTLPAGAADFYLSEPDEWLMINISGTNYVLPAYEA